MTVDHKRIFADADAVLALLAGLREKSAALLAKPSPPLGGMPAAIDEIADLQASAAETIKEAGAHEEALRGVEHDLILSNDDAAIGKLEAKLKSLRANCERLAVFRGELSARSESMRKAVAEDGVRRYAVAKRAEVEEHLEHLKTAPELIAKFEALFEAREKIKNILSDMWREQQRFPDVEETGFPDYRRQLREPIELLAKLARMNTDLVSPPRGLLSLG